MGAVQLTLLPPARPLAERFGADFFRSAPERPGVYLLCGDAAGVLYVGKARNLRRRLASYRSAQPERLPRKLSRMLALVRRIHWDECPDEGAALARERQLLLALRPPFNTIGVHPRPRRRIGWTLDAAAPALAWGDPADRMPECTERLAGCRSVFEPLARLVWGAAHPGRPLMEMPPRLIHGPPPAVVPLTGAGGAAGAGLWLELNDRLARFFAGVDPTLPQWLAAHRRATHAFDAAWTADDADRLGEWGCRWAGVDPRHAGAGSPAAAGGDGAADLAPEFPLTAPAQAPRCIASRE